MAVFRPTQENDVCELNFDDKFVYKISLDEETNLDIAKIGERHIENLQKLTENTPDAFKKAYNSTLDAIDEILGDGAGADIMSLYEKPGLVQIGQVLNFILEEYGNSYKAMFDKYKSTATLPPAHPAIKRGRK